MERICSPSQCSGCGSCVNVCPQGAVSLVNGSLGAVLSHVDQSLCVDCGLCVKVCPVRTPVPLRVPTHSYASYAKDGADRAASASGGASAMFVNSVLEEGGVAYGCAQREDCNIGHIRVSDISEAGLLKGSKYVYGNVADIYSSVLNDLKEQRKVFFTGLPCQVAGLVNLVARHPGLDRLLFTADLCCHGAPSLPLLKEHVRYLGLSSRADKAVFREKTSSGISYLLALYDSDGKRLYRRSSRKDYYMTGFVSGMFMRENCFNCPYARKERCSDITFADHWAMGRSDDPQMSYAKGISTILVNTPKGKSLLESASGHLILESRPMEEALRNARFIRPIDRPEDYERFAISYESGGYEASCRKFLPAYMRRTLLDEIRSRYYRWPVRQFIRKLLKK